MHINALLSRGLDEAQAILAELYEAGRARFGNARNRGQDMDGPLRGRSGFRVSAQVADRMRQRPLVLEHLAEITAVEKTAWRAFS
jgi:hypothetical protein